MTANPPKSGGNSLDIGTLLLMHALVVISYFDSVCVCVYCPNIFVDLDWEGGEGGEGEVQWIQRRYFKHGNASCENTHTHT